MKKKTDYLILNFELKLLELPSFPDGDTVLDDVFKVLLIKRGSGPDDVLIVGVEASSL